jgi:hypothetical protein
MAILPDLEAILPKSDLFERIAVLLSSSSGRRLKVPLDAELDGEQLCYYGPTPHSTLSYCMYSSYVYRLHACLLPVLSDKDPDLQ